MRIAVVTPAYNAAPTIADAIRSVLEQTHRDVRHIVVDDGSTDATAAIAARLADPRLTLIWQCNAGVAAARNRGMAAAECDALLFLDADDWLASTALATLSAALEAAPAAVAAVGPYARMGEDGQPTGRRTRQLRAAPRHLLDRLVVQNQFANGGHLLIRRDAARQAGKFLPGVAYGEDWEYFVRLALLGPFVFVPEPRSLLFVRSRAEGAYRRLATDPGAFVPCMAAIFGNPRLAEHFGATRLAALRRRAEAENAWIIGRELVRNGRPGEGRRWLERSVAAAPSPLRLGLLAVAHALPLLPQALRGPFRAYADPCVNRI